MATQLQGPSNGLGTGAMVIGIVALVLALIPGIGLVSILLAPVAIVLGIIALSRAELPRGGAKAGIITGGMALLVCALWIGYLGSRSSGPGARSTEITTQWLIGRWSYDTACPPADVLSLMADGSYTGPSTIPGRLALGVWSYENGSILMGTVTRMDSFRVERVSEDGLRITGDSGSRTFHRC